MIIYRNARVLTLSSSGLIDKGAVVVDGNKIIRVCPEAELNFKNYSDAQTVDLNGMFIMPGLINGHHHSAMWKNYGKITAFTHDPATQAFMAARLALVALKKGVLAVRDLGHKGDGHTQLKLCRDKGVLLAPRIRGAIELIGFPFGTAPAFTAQIISADEMRREILRQANDGTDFIKIMANNERMTHIDYEDLACPWLSQEIMDTAVETAHMVGLKVAVHANGRTAVNWCINSGVDVIEHGRCIDDEMAKRMADKGIVYVPTLSGQKANATPGWGRDDIQPRYEKSWKKLTFSMEHVVKNGVRIVAGTDCLGSVCEEIVLLHEVGGLSTLEAIKAATVYAADLMGMSGLIGTVEAGKLADFIVVDGNPLETPGILEDNVKFISLDGKWYDTAWFAKLIPECDYWAPGF
ncbi:MAG: amidohydrolase family protein [Oscillospiraceae bacterium]